MELGTFKRDFNRFVSKFPTDVQEVIKKKAYLAGGALRSLTLGEKPNDYDIYFLDGMALSVVNSASRDIRGGQFSDNAITFLDIDKSRIPFQIITSYFGSPHEVISKFDFTVNMNFYVPAMEWGEIKYPLDINCKELRFNPKATKPIGALLRINRFLREGWTIRPEQLARIGIAISRQGSLEGLTVNEMGLSDSSSGSTEKLDINEIMAKDIDYVRKKTVPGSSLFNIDSATYDLWRAAGRPVNYGNYTASVDLLPTPVDPLPRAVNRSSLDTQGANRLEQAINRAPRPRLSRRRGSGAEFPTLADRIEQAQQILETSQEITHNQNQEIVRTDEVPF